MLKIHVKAHDVSRTCRSLLLDSVESFVWTLFFLFVGIRRTVCCLFVFTALSLTISCSCWLTCPLDSGLAFQCTPPFVLFILYNSVVQVLFLIRVEVRRSLNKGDKSRENDFIAFMAWFNIFKLSGLKKNNE